MDYIIAILDFSLLKVILDLNTLKYKTCQPLARPSIVSTSVERMLEMMYHFLDFQYGFALAKNASGNYEQM